MMWATDIIIASILVCAMIWPDNVGVTFGLIIYGFRQGCEGPITHSARSATKEKSNVG